MGARALNRFSGTIVSPGGVIFWAVVLFAQISFGASYDVYFTITNTGTASCTFVYSAQMSVSGVIQSSGTGSVTVAAGGVSGHLATVGWPSNTASCSWALSYLRVSGTDVAYSKASEGWVGSAFVTTFSSSGSPPPPPWPDLALHLTGGVDNFGNTARTVELKNALETFNVSLGTAPAATSSTVPGHYGIAFNSDANSLGFDIRGQTFEIWVDGVRRGHVTVPVEQTTDFSFAFGTFTVGDPDSIEDNPIAQPSATPSPIPSPSPSPSPVPTPTATPKPLPSGTPAISASGTYAPWSGIANVSSGSMAKNDFYEATRRGLEDANGGASTFTVTETETDQALDTTEAGKLGLKTQRLMTSVNNFMSAGQGLIGSMKIYFPVYAGGGAAQTFSIPLPNGDSAVIDFSEMPYRSVIRNLAGFFILTCGIASAMSLVRGMFAERS